MTMTEGERLAFRFITMLRDWKDSAREIDEALEQAYQHGFEAGQKNMLEAGYRNDH